MRLGYRWAALVALAHYVIVCLWYPLVDDYFIFLRYADNALAGHGLTFNVGGEHVEGYTSFLYLLILTALRAIHISPVLCGRVVNAALFVALPLATARIARRVQSRHAMVMPILVATSHPLAVHASAGMEAALLSLLVVFGLDALMLEPTYRSRLIAGLLFGAAILTRPEAGLMFAVCFVWAVGFGVRKSTMARDVWTLVGVGVVIAPHLLWRRAYYGYWLPNSFYAKTGGPWVERISEGILGLHRALITGPGMLMVLAVVAWVLAPKNRVSTLFFCLMSVSGVTLLVEGVDDWVYWWHSSLLSLFTTLLLGQSICLIAASGALTRSRSLRLTMIAACGGYASMLFVGMLRHRVVVLERIPMLLVVGLAAYAIATQATQRAVRFVAIVAVCVGAIRATGHADPRSVPNDLTPVAHAVSNFARPTDTIATGAAGAIPFYTRLYTYDTLGINDVHIAHASLDTLRYGGFAHHRGDGPYILARRPTLLLPRYDLTDAPEPGPGYEKTFNEMFELPEFAELYEYRAAHLDDGRYLNYYRLRDRK